MYGSPSGEAVVDETDDGDVTTTRDPLDGHISPVICKDGIINNLEGLLNYIASGWKYHVSNTDGVKQAWSKFDNVTNKICSFMSGELLIHQRTSLVLPLPFMLIALWAGFFPRLLCVMCSPARFTLIFEQLLL
ncbi:unnamed protein product [Haemonchus placei]|uniref:Pecanex-like protein n=1 Tax=Haemonchus placei TaxID=6290 RepID=A0A0N4WN41_HAEPC|nr:unnamed protein product [Haemonchus placei]